MPLSGVRKPFGIGDCSIAKVDRYDPCARLLPFRTNQEKGEGNLVLDGRDEASEGFGPEALDAFAEGYGIPLSELLPALQKRWLSDSIDVIRWAIDKRPDLLDGYVRKGQAAVAEWRAGR